MHCMAVRGAPGDVGELQTTCGPRVRLLGWRPTAMKGSPSALHTEPAMYAIGSFYKDIYVQAIECDPLLLPIPNV